MDTCVSKTDNYEIIGDLFQGSEDILTDDAVQFICMLEEKFGKRRIELLEKRAEIQTKIDKGHFPDFCSETSNIRKSNWKVSPLPEDLQDRRVEITGPDDRKMIINALNSGVKVFMADFEDSNSPTWENCVNGQINLKDAVDKSITFIHPVKDKVYKLNEKNATLMVRPRGWHLEEKNFLYKNKPVSASIFDFGLYFLN